MLCTLCENLLFKGLSIFAIDICSGLKNLKSLGSLNVEIILILNAFFHCSGFSECYAHCWKPVVGIDLALVNKRRFDQHKRLCISTYSIIQWPYYLSYMISKSVTRIYLVISTPQSIGIYKFLKTAVCYFIHQNKMTFIFTLLWVKWIFNSQNCLCKLSKHKDI